MKISPARQAAFDVLLRIERDSAFSSVLLPQVEETLSPADRALCHELVLGLLRRRLLLDRLIDELAARSVVDLEVRVALQLGLFQILYLDKIPDHAAVNDSVALVARAKKSSAKGLVNAILRKASKGFPTISYSDNLERISLESSHPCWLVGKWSNDFGKDIAEKIVAANNIPPSITFRKTFKGRDIRLANDYERSSYVEGCIIAERSGPELRRLSDDGLIYFQDEASQMVAAAVSVASGGRFLDVCAAPGGKTTAIAARVNLNAVNERPTFVAGDTSHTRTVFLKENCRRQGADFVHIAEYDASFALPFEDSSFDSVLVDAPCSGTGTIRHNPEIRYFVEPTDFAGLQRTQLAILENASKLVKPGGQLIYSTCSLEIEENEAVCRQFLSGASDFRSVRPRVPDRFITADGFARTFPYDGGMDGFFIAAFARS